MRKTKNIKEAEIRFEELKQKAKKSPLTDQEKQELRELTRLIVTRLNPPSKE